MYTIAEFAHQKNKSEAQVRWAIRSGKIKVSRIGFGEGWGQYRIGISENQLEKI